MGKILGTGREGCLEREARHTLETGALLLGGPHTARLHFSCLLHPSGRQDEVSLFLAELIPASTFTGKLTEHKEEMCEKAQDVRIAKFPIPLTLQAHTVVVKSHPHPPTHAHTHILGGIRP